MVSNWAIVSLLYISYMFVVLIVLLFPVSMIVGDCNWYINYCLFSTICVNLYLVRGESPYKLFLAFDSFLLHLLFSLSYCYC